MLSLYAAAAACGAVIGMAMYKQWKSVQREKRIRDGFIISKPIRYTWATCGAFAAVAITRLAGWQSLGDVVKSSSVVWLPVFCETAMIVTRNHLMNLLVKPVDDKGKEITNDPSTAMCHAKLWDRLKYTLFMANVGLTAFILGKCPEKMYLYYALKMAILMPLRITEFRKARMQLYNYELCLFVNYFFLAYLFLSDGIYDSTLRYIFGDRSNLFGALFGLANGPVGWYIIGFDGTLSMFDRGRTTSAFIHFAPPLVTYCVRHYNDHKLFPVPSSTDGMFTRAFSFYGSWIAFQYFVVLGLYHSQIKQRDLVCLWTEPQFDAVRRFTRRHSINRLVYCGIHMALCAGFMGLAPLLYNSEPAHFAYIFFLALYCVWNGSAETFDRFKDSYNNELKARLQLKDEEEQNLDPTLVASVKKLICEAANKEEMTPETLGDRSLTDLGLDSIRVGTLGARLQDEFRIYDLEVAELMGKNVSQLAKLVSERAGKGNSKIDEAPLSFFTEPRRPEISMAPGETVAEKFLNTCDRLKGFAAVADDSKPGGNILTYERLKTAALLFAKFIHAQDDLKDQKRIGVMMPASVGATVITFGALVSGKVPVMINFTMGADKIRHTLVDSGISHVISSKKFVTTLRGKGVELPDDLLSKMFIFAEDIANAFTTFDQLYTLVGMARRPAKTILANFKNTHTVADHVAILFTSGSTSNPKGVPLTNRNVIENIKEVIVRGEFNNNVIIMAALPPFHSFGFAATTINPMITGMKCVYYPNPTAFFDISRQMARWKPTHYLSTPSWMAKVWSASKKNPEWTQSLRTIIVGAEACPQALKDDAAKRGCGVIEGYGITETSPVLCTTKLGVKPLGVGWALDNVRLKIVVLGDLAEAEAMGNGAPEFIKQQVADKKALKKKLDGIANKNSDEARLLECRLARPLVTKEVAPDEKDKKGDKALGLIVVSGPNIFGDSNGEAYLNHKVYEKNDAGKFKFDPFFEYEGKVWYNTEDLGRFDSSSMSNGVPAMVIGGRVKRFVKRAGEMISLGAIEEPLINAFPDVDQKRAYACESTEIKTAEGGIEPRIGCLVLQPDDQVEGRLTRAEAMEKVKSALSTKFSGGALNLHMPDDVIFVAAIPMLGTGKLDLQGCKKAVADFYMNKK